MKKPISNADIQQRFSEAVRKLQAGDFLRAKNGLEEVAAVVPENETVQYYLGMCHQYLGMNKQAVTVYSALCAKNPKHVEALVNLGIAYQALEQTDLAEKNAQQALEQQPGHPRAANLLGTISASAGEFAKAVTYFKEVLKADPDNIDARINLSTALYESGQWDAAFSELQPLMAQKPGQTALLLAGQILVKQKNVKRLSEVLGQLKSRFPEHNDTKLLDLSYSESLKDHGEVINKAQSILETSPDNDLVWNSLGQAYFLSGKVDDAMSCFQKAIELAPGIARYYNNAGLVHASWGKKQEAEACYRKAIEVDPGYGEAYRSLSALKTFETNTDNDLQLFERSWNSLPSSDPARCALAFALGKAYDDCAEYEQAFAVYQKGNELRMPLEPNREVKHLQQFERIIQSFDAKPLSGASVTSPTSRPIFILGMPRSGTTLVEQVLSRHPQIVSCGELPFIERAITQLEGTIGSGERYPKGFKQLTSVQLSEEAERYINSVADSHPLSPGWFTDKMPLNFRHIWLIKALFPHSQIIHCKRHPLDTILSNYFQLYGADTIDFVYDLTALTNYYIGYENLMRHWNRVFPEQLYCVQYESIVADNENQIRSLADGIGLEWDARLLQHQASESSVRTASIWQVRKGIYTSSVARWQHYLGPLEVAIDILQKAKILNSDLEEIAA